MGISKNYATDVVKNNINQKWVNKYLLQLKTRYAFGTTGFYIII